MKSAIYLFGKFITLMNPYGLRKGSLIVWRVKKVSLKNSNPIFNNPEAIFSYRYEEPME